MLLVWVLGPTTVSRAGDADVELGARRHAEVLAILAAHRGHQVRAGTLADLVWSGSPPPSAPTTLQGYISRLRRLLDPGRTGAGAAAIVTVGDGYRLDLDTDASRFEATIRRSREMLPSQARHAAEQLADALAQWRGRGSFDVAS